MLRAAVAVAALSLAAAPGAAAWTTLGSGLLPTVTPSLIATQAGTELAVFDSPSAGTISVSRSGGAPKVVVSGDPSANGARLVQQPSGAIQLYFPNAQGVGRLTSTDDGVSWTGPVQTQSHTTGPVEAAAVLPDGTPLFSQDGTGFVNVFRGLNGETVKNVYARCCGYHESLAVDSTGLVQIAFFSNADPSWATVYAPLGADLTPGVAFPLKPVAEHEAPLVADRSGNSFLAWAPGYPTATGVSVVPFRAGSPAGDGVSLFRGAFGDNEHLALAVDPQDRVWALWTAAGSLFAARSRSHAMHFGATVHVALPGTAHTLSALGLDGTPGTVDAVVNTGSSLVREALQPGLSVRVFKKTKKVGAKKVVTWWAQALDDGFGVPGVTFSAPGRHAKGNASGIAQLSGAGFRPGSAKAAAPGYVSAAFRVP
ncbi:MAG: hypothetical protein QOK22_2109 [Gaiellaceae bacterium]|nr:hypothetical protein [Gaiellaceae bacterium]